MTCLPRLGTLAILAVAGAHFAAADTLTLASYGSTNTAPVGTSNTGLLYGSAATYNVGTGGVWHDPIGSSSWVSNNLQNFPGGSNIEPSKTFTYTSTFLDNSASTSTGSITILADDTSDIYLNGTLVASASPANPATHCTQVAPNCEVPATYTLTGFKDGINTLKFDVSQDFGGAEGIDFAGTVNTSPVPEPSSLLLLGTGLLSTAGALYRRMRA